MTTTKTNEAQQVALSTAQDIERVELLQDAFNALSGGNVTWLEVIQDSDDSPAGEPAQDLEIRAAELALIQTLEDLGIDPADDVDASDSPVSLWLSDVLEVTQVGKRAFGSEEWNVIETRVLLSFGGPNVWLVLGDFRNEVQAFWGSDSFTVAVNADNIEAHLEI